MAMMYFKVIHTKTQYLLSQAVVNIGFSASILLFGDVLFMVTQM